MTALSRSCKLPLTISLAEAEEPSAQGQQGQTFDSFEDFEDFMHSFGGYGF